MLKQLWITGILVAFSVFGIKVGLGLGAQIYNRTVPLGKKVIFFYRRPFYLSDPFLLPVLCDYPLQFVKLSGSVCKYASIRYAASFSSGAGASSLGRPATPSKPS